MIYPKYTKFKVAVKKENETVKGFYPTVILILSVEETNKLLVPKYFTVLHGKMKSWLNLVKEGRREYLYKQRRT